MNPASLGEINKRVGLLISCLAVEKGDLSAVPWVAVDALNTATARRRVDPQALAAQKFPADNCPRPHYTGVPQDWLLWFSEPSTEQVH